MGEDPLYLVCVEPRFPGRLGGVADWLVRKRGFRCWFFCHQAGPPATWPESAAAGRGLDVIAYGVGGVAREASVPWTRQLERGLCYAFGAYEVLQARRPQPVDVVIGRSAGLGSTLYVPPTLSGVPIVNLYDYYYQPREYDLAPELVDELPADYEHWRRSANAMDLLDLENGGHPWAPTAWQRDLYPAEYRGDFTVRFDGVDAGRFARDRTKGRRVVAGRTVPADMKLVTFVARDLDALRGFDRFAALAARLLRDRPDVICAAAGGPTVSRSLDVRWFGRDYADEVLVQRPMPDPSRFWRLGALAPEGVAELLGASDLHVYPSRAYPPSASLAEAMAAGCVALAWDTGPVREWVEPGRNGLLAADLDDAATQALRVLADPGSAAPLGTAAASMARERLDRDAVGPGLAAWLNRLARGGSDRS